MSLSALASTRKVTPCGVSSRGGRTGSGCAELSGVPIASFMLFRLFPQAVPLGQQRLRRRRSTDATAQRPCQYEHMYRLATYSDLPAIQELERAAGQAFRSLGMDAVADDQPIQRRAFAEYM